MTNDEYKIRTRLVAKVLRDVLTTMRFDTLADVEDATKSRLAQLRIPYDSGLVNDACRLVGSNTALHRPSPLVRPRCRRVVERQDDGLSHADAAATLRRLGLLP